MTLTFLAKQSHPPVSTQSLTYLVYNFKLVCLIERKICYSPAPAFKRNFKQRGIVYDISRNFKLEGYKVKFKKFT